MLRSKPQTEVVLEIWLGMYCVLILIRQVLPAVMLQVAWYGGGDQRAIP